MKALKFPTAQTILILIALVVMLLTWIVPSGKYDTLLYDSAGNSFVKTTTDASVNLPATQQTLNSLNIKIPIEKFTSGSIYKPISIPDTYVKTTPQPQNIGAFIKAPVKGIIAAADIIFFVLIIGGLVNIMNATGAFDAGIVWLGNVLRGKEYLLIIIVTTLIAIGGTTFGMAEETMAFYPILIPVFLAAGYDALVGLSCIFLGSAIGSMCSVINPFATIIASDAAGISWTTGIGNRIIMLIVCLTVTVLYILRYAKQVKNNPARSIIYDQKAEIEQVFGAIKTRGNIHFNNKLRLILLVFLASFLIMILGITIYHWWFVEMASTFVVSAIVIAFIAKMKEDVFVSVFAKGAGDLLGVAFIIGIARGITILMEDGNISATILHFATRIVTGMNEGVFANTLLFVYGGLSFFMPSTSGMAVLTMPIIAPLADAVHVGRETVIDSYLYGMGLFYIINPTSLILAALAVTKIGFNKWIKFVMPLMFMLLLATLVLLTISVYR